MVLWVFTAGFVFTHSGYGSEPCYGSKSCYVSESCYGSELSKPQIVLLKFLRILGDTSLIDLVMLKNVVLGDGPFDF